MNLNARLGKMLDIDDTMHQTMPMIISSSFTSGDINFYYQDSLQIAFIEF